MMHKILASVADLKNRRTPVVDTMNSARMQTAEREFARNPLAKKLSARNIETKAFDVHFTDDG